MNWTLEVVSVPVADVDRAKAFYGERLGFPVDFDSAHGDTRVVQVTPPGSGCSISFGKGLGLAMEPGTLQGVQLVVADLKEARAHLVERGVDVSEIQVHGRDGRVRPYEDGEALDNVGFVFFSDPDGNGWAVQQIGSRA